MKNSKSKLKPFGVKLSDKERLTLQRLANKFMNGNLSKWLRIAGLKYRPKKLS